MAPVKRGWFLALQDYLASWYWRLPSASSTYTIERVRIPISSSVFVVVDLYQPLDTPPISTLLVRSPYGIDGIISLRYARIFAARGYQVVLAACRGTSGSEGSFYPFRDEKEDGEATVKWMKEQPWYTGSFAMIGVSYLGFTQWGVLSNESVHPDMRTAIAHVGPHDFGKFVWGTGALNSGVVVWADMMMRMLRGEGVSLLLHLRSWKKRLPSLVASTPLLNAVEKDFEGKMPHWARDWITHPNLMDSYWKPFQHNDALQRAKMPILLVSGWYDICISQVMEQYTKLAERGVAVGLTVGPWAHTEAATNTTLESLTWLNQHLSQSENGSRQDLVRIYVTGAQQWRDLPQWPPLTTPQAFYLHPNSRLSKDIPSANAVDSTFKFDPADPTPTIGSSTFVSMAGGKEDDAALAARSDVLSFTTEPLDYDLEVYGKPTVELCHSTSHAYADLLVRLCEVDPKGRSRNVAETYMRLDRRRSEEPKVHLTLGDCAHRFRKGCRIRMVVAGGSHPLYVRNLGTSEDSVTGLEMKPVWHTVKHGSEALSRIILPTAIEEA